MKPELLVILTPHIVRSPLERERILAEEARRIDWIMSDVVKVHGTSGMAPILSPPPGAPGAGLPGGTPDPARWPGISYPPASLPGPSPTAPAGQGSLPPSRNTSGSQSQGSPNTAAPASWPNQPAALPSAGSTASPPQAPAPLAAQISENGLVAPVEPPKEKRGWNLLPSKN